MKARNDFAVFILTHGRADNVKTYATLRRQGYTGKIYLIVDDMDGQQEAYKKTYGDQVIVFDKLAEVNKVDAGDNFKKYGCALFARSACFDIAKKLGLKYFLELDDDYCVFQIRFGRKFEYLTTKHKLKNLDRMFELTVEFLEQSKIDTFCYAQFGDFMGGRDSQFSQKVKTKRKAMNTFFFRTDSEIRFISTINDDVTTYVTLGSRGKLFLTTNQISIDPTISQAATGGITELYKDVGTYVKSFYSVMYHPSSVTIRTMGRSNRRLHHSINWKMTVPKILRQEVKK